MSRDEIDPGGWLDDWWIARRSRYRSGTNSRVVNGLTAPSNWSMTLCPRDVTECNAPVTWQRVLQAKRCTEIACAFSLLLPRSFLPFLHPSLSTLPLSPCLFLHLCISLYLPLPPSVTPSLLGLLPFRTARASESRNLVGVVAKNGHVTSPRKMSSARKGATRREAPDHLIQLRMTLITRDSKLSGLIRAAIGGQKIACVPGEVGAP